MIAGALLFGPMFIPGMAVHRAWHWLASWFADVVLGIELPPLVFTGSGDQLFHYVQLLIVVIVAVIGTAIWSWLTPRRAHPHLAASGASTASSSDGVELPPIAFVERGQRIWHYERINRERH